MTKTKRTRNYQRKAYSPRVTSLALLLLWNQADLNWQQRTMRLSYISSLRVTFIRPRFKLSPTRRLYITATSIMYSLQVRCWLRHRQRVLRTCARTQYATHRYLSPDGIDRSNGSGLKNTRKCKQLLFLFHKEDNSLQVWRMFPTKSNSTAGEFTRKVGSYRRSTTHALYEA